MPPSRNAPCPCGSGQKYKHCHGALDPSAHARSAGDAESAQQLREATNALGQGNLVLVDLICREVLERVPMNPTALALLGRVAIEVGRFDHAIRYLAEALRRDPEIDGARRALEQARAALARDRAEPTRGSERRARVLLIKAWGYGFWSDVDHVAGQLLLAEMTRRVPIVRWGSNSLFSDPEADNAFELYFLPVSPLRIQDVADATTSYYPPKWRRENLFAEDVNKFTGSGSRLGGLHFLGRDEDVAVSDFHTAVNDLIPWIEPGSPYFGLDRQDIYRRLFARYLKLRPHLEQRIERFWERNMAGRRWLAVHVRGSDKVHEVGNLTDVNANYFARIDPMIDALPGLSIFLLTDSEQALEEFRGRYGPRLLHSASTRSSTTTGVHRSGHPGRRIAEEVILDTYVAARCDRFLGNGSSNVSTTVAHLKDWSPDAYALLGANFLATRNTFLHRW